MVCNIRHVSWDNYLCARIIPLLNIERSCAAKPPASPIYPWHHTSIRVAAVPLPDGVMQPIQITGLKVSIDQIPDSISIYPDPRSLFPLMAAYRADLKAPQPISRPRKYYLNQEHSGNLVVRKPGWTTTRKSNLR